MSLNRHDVKTGDQCAKYYTNDLRTLDVCTKSPVGFLGRAHSFHQGTPPALTTVVAPLSGTVIEFTAGLTHYTAIYPARTQWLGEALIPGAADDLLAQVYFLFYIGISIWPQVGSSPLSSAGFLPSSS